MVAMAGETQKGAMELARTMVTESNDTARTTAKESNLTARDSIAAETNTGMRTGVSFFTPSHKHRSGVDTSTLSKLKKKVCRMEHKLKETQESLFNAIELFGKERDRAQHFEEQLEKANSVAETLAELCQRLAREMDSLDMDKELLLERAEMDREAIKTTDEDEELLLEQAEMDREEIEATSDQREVDPVGGLRHDVQTSSLMLGMMHKV